jgi:two-component system, OmpR family, sensor histidine kinase ChvG
VDRLRRLVSGISIRLLAFNLLLVFLPASGVLYLDTFERHLLEAQERAMVQQGRVLAAALSGRGELAAPEAERILLGLRQRLTSRLRVLDGGGRLLADSSLLGPRREPAAAAPAPEPDPRSGWLYRAGAALAALAGLLPGGSEPAGVVEEDYAADRPFSGAEVRAALAGRYGAATRVSPGQRSVTLYSAIPVFAGERVVGAVLVSQSTLRLLASLYAVRLDVFRVFLASVAAAVVLSLLVSTTIVRPLGRLRREAAELLDRRGRLRGRFGGSQRRDEIGDLARALEELSRRLAERIRFIESFAADVSHEFKNPLASIRAATEMLGEADDPAERRHFVHLVEGEVARLERLLSGVREVTLIDAQLDDERAPVELAALLAALVDAFRLRAAGGGVEIALRLPDEPLRALASADRLAEAVENLLANALSFAPAGSAVEVALERRRGEAAVTVRDHGPGIPPEHLERVFDRFFSFRAGEKASRKEHAGLGLAIARAIAEGSGGSLTAANAPDGGAAFELRLPLIP